MAWKTRSGGAAMKTSARTVSWSGVMVAVAMFVSFLDQRSNQNQRQRRRTEPVPSLPKGVSAPHLTLYEILQVFDHARPASAVVLAGCGFLGEAAVRHFHSRAARLGHEFPPHDGAPRFIVMPVGDPAVSEPARRIVFKDLTLTTKFADTPDFESAGLGIVAPAASGFRFHGEGLDRTNFTGPPGHDLLGIDEGLEDALGRSSDLDLADDGILI